MKTKIKKSKPQNIKFDPISVQIFQFVDAFFKTRGQSPDLSTLINSLIRNGLESFTHMFQRQFTQHEAMQLNHILKAIKYEADQKRRISQSPILTSTGARQAAATQPASTGPQDT